MNEKINEALDFLDEAMSFINAYNGDSQSISDPIKAAQNLLEEIKEEL